MKLYQTNIHRGDSMNNTLPSRLTTSTGISIDKRTLTNNFPGHFHNFYEIEYILNGKGTMMVNNIDYPIKNNSLFFFTPLDFQQIKIDGPMELINVSLSPEWIRKNLSNELNQFCIIYDYQFPYADRLCSEYKKSLRYNFDIIESLLTIILVDISRNIRNSEIKSGTRYSKSIRSAINYIHLHFRENITLEEVAKQSHLTPQYLSSAFKKSTNLTFSRYLIDLRITYAKYLLCSTETSITDICYQSGFSSYSNFSRFFKEKNNTTPKIYRELNSNTSTQFHKPIDYKIE